MDPRQPPQHPFSRNTASPYGRTAFPSASNQPQYPSSSHPPPAAPAYADHQRRPSDPPYYNSQRSYGQDGPPMAGPGHSRHQSSSSVGHGTPVNRNMPPPSSPQQQASHHYGPPPPRAPPVSVGPPSGFPNNRELPALPPLGGRPQSGMSISSILGGPTPSREPPHTQSQYASPVATSAPPSSLFGPTRASPRTTNVEYPAYRRPQTPPEHPRQYETRDHRANSAGSPPGLGHYGTPESRRFGTPQQAYAQRVSGPEERREPVRVPNPNVSSSVPPRPNSQPSGFNPPPRMSESRANESIFGRRVDNAPRPEPPRETTYGRPPPYEERHVPYGYAERERQERERERERDMLMQRDRERELREQALDRERERERETIRAEQQRASEYAQRMAQRNPQPGYNRPPEPREQPAWMRNYDAPPPPRPVYDQPPAERQPPVSNGYNYPATTAPQFSGHPAYATEPRYGQPPQSKSGPTPQVPVPTTIYEAAMQERQRLAQQEQDRQMYGGPQNAYPTHESPQRREEAPQMQQQRSFLGVQGLDRKGNRSPLPQAVQGAQSQVNAPGGDPAIKNEFGRIWSGLGGVSGQMGVPSPLSAQAQGLPFSTPGLRREDLENLQDLHPENGQKVSRTASGNGRRRRLKEEGGDDESSTGRRTPSGRGKRTKTHHHHHPPHHHHHHRAEPVDNTSSPTQSNLTPFKSVKGANIPSPPGRDFGGTPTMHHHHIQRHHHHVTPARLVIPVDTIIPLRKVTIRNQEVLDAVASFPRRHLGHGYYKSKLGPEPSSSIHLSERNSSKRRGFASTAIPLPRFEGSENCTFTVKVPRVYLSHISREEITARKGLWGTDIYTDDSDIIAACIHQGWFKGAWPADVDESLLDLRLVHEGPVDYVPPFDKIWTSPPVGGPVDVPKNRDLQVTIVVLPPLSKYSSLTRFGIMSREWGGKYDGFQSNHDGMSFMIESIQWVDGVDGQEGRSGKERKGIISAALRDAELEAAEVLRELGCKRGSVSFERGEGPVGEFKGVGMGSWLKPDTSRKGKEKEREKETAHIPVPEVPEIVEVVDRANVPEAAEEKSEPVDSDQKRRISLVTDLMIANANTADYPSLPHPAPTVEDTPHRLTQPPEATDANPAESKNDAVENADMDMDTTL